jgi:hypothetical protein
MNSSPRAKKACRAGSASVFSLGVSRQSDSRIGLLLATTWGPVSKRGVAVGRGRVDSALSVSEPLLLPDIVAQHSVDLFQAQRFRKKLGPVAHCSD